MWEEYIQYLSMPPGVKRRGFFNHRLHRFFNRRLHGMNRREMVRQAHHPKQSRGKTQNAQKGQKNE